jgi:hypothetical protein
MVKKEGTVVVLSVQLGGPLMMVVLDAKRAVLEHLVLGVKIVRWVTQERETTLMLHNANNVH